MGTTAVAAGVYARQADVLPNVLLFPRVDARVGIRELRQNLSVYLRRVMQGERLIVTDRREPVAELRPLTERTDPYERWLRENALLRPTGDLGDVTPVDLGAGNPGTRTLEETREERLA